MNINSICKKCILVFILMSLLLILGFPNNSLQAKNQSDIPYVVKDAKGIAMVYLPEGSFHMGIDISQVIELCKNSWPEGFDMNLACSKNTFDEYPISLPPQLVEVSPFYMDQFEVSLGNYLDCVHVDVCTTEFLRQEMEAIDSGDDVPMNVPVTGASYYNGAVYCAWRDARIPSEIEWEYAARGVNATIFPWGNEFDGTLTNFCDSNCHPMPNNHWNDGYTGKAPVDAFPKGQSWAGVYNLGGNVSEWTSTRNYNEFGMPIDHTRVIKGGSYRSLIFQTASWWRILSLENEYASETGFRCARTTQP